MQYHDYLMNIMFTEQDVEHLLSIPLLQLKR